MIVSLIRTVYFFFFLTQSRKYGHNFKLVMEDVLYEELIWTFSSFFLIMLGSVSAQIPCTKKYFQIVPKIAPSGGQSAWFRFSTDSMYQKILSNYTKNSSLRWPKSSLLSLAFRK